MHLIVAIETLSLIFCQRLKPLKIIKLYLTSPLPLHETLLLTLKLRVKALVVNSQKVI